VYGGEERREGWGGAGVSRGRAWALTGVGILIILGILVVVVTAVRSSL
jgi:hypothetical protein